MIVNPILRGFNPDPSIVRVKDDYYIATSTFEWFPGVQIHHSRVLRFTGRELPHSEMVRENYWGASELEHLWEELQKRSSTSANIAQLVFQANITTLKISDFGDALAMGTEQQKQQIREAMMDQNRFRTSFGLQLLSAGDSLENHPYAFGGLAEIYEQFMLDMAGAAEIPAVKLFGRSPAGMNATGESDLKNYYELIARLQERHLRPALEKLLPVLALSAWGTLPEDMSFVFNPIAAESPRESAELAEKLAARRAADTEKTLEKDRAIAARFNA
jgi:phage-related protein (TIGR01555 family)